MPARSQLRVDNVVEADNILILIVLLFVDRSLERNEREEQTPGFLLRSDADLLVPPPVLCLLLLGTVLSLLTPGAELRGRDLAVRKGTVRRGLGRGCGFGRSLARFHFWGRLVSLGEMRANWYAMSVRRKSNRLQGCVWDGEIDETEKEGRTSEKVIDRIRAIPVPMSHKRVVTRSSSRLKAQESGAESGSDDGGSQNQGQGQGPIVAPASPTTKDDFMATDDFMRLLRGYVDVTDLFHTFRLVSKPWQRIVEELIDREFESGVLAFHDGNDINYDEVDARRERRALVARVVFLLNITEVGDCACCLAVNLVVVDIPEGVERIRDSAFASCSSLTTVSFPTTLTLVESVVFYNCTSLENVDLRHTNLQELGECAFQFCSELKSMTIPDSLQKLGKLVFYNCFKLVHSYIDVGNSSNDATSEVLKYLYEKMKSDHMAKDIKKIIVALNSNATADQTTRIASLEAELKIARLELRAEKAEKQNTELRASKEIASLKQQLTSPTGSKKRKHN